LGYEYLHLRRLSRLEKEEYFNDIRSIARMMEIQDFPEDYHHYLTLRTQMVVRELQFNPYTRELLEAYRKNIGAFRYWGLLQFQARFIDPILTYRLGLKANRFFGWVYWFYPHLRFKPLFLSLASLMLKGESRSVIQQFAVSQG
jgi:hypothetical protein